jgi:hypothetical protein
MQKRLLLPLILPLALTLGWGCTPASEPSDSNGGSTGSNSGGSGSSNSGGSGSSNTGGSSSGNTGGSSGGSSGSGSGGSSGGSSGTSGGSSGEGGSSSGGSSGSSGGSTGSGGSTSADASTGTETGMPSAGGPAGPLDKFVFDVPCPEGTVKAAGNCTVADAAARKKTKMITFGGDPNTTYKVKLNVCGPMEGRGYTGCAMGPESPIVCMDGMPMPGQYQVTYPTYSMAVSAPAHKYYLNNKYKADDIAKIEYTSTFEIKGGATITFETDGGSNPDVYTADYKKHNLQCPGAPGIMQPFAGQFIYTTVMSVDPMN